MRFETRRSGIDGVEDHRLPIGLRGWTTTGYATGNLGWQVGGVTALPGSAGACDLQPPPGPSRVSNPELVLLDDLETALGQRDRQRLAWRLADRHVHDHHATPRAHPPACHPRHGNVQGRSRSQSDQTRIRRRGCPNLGRRVGHVTNGIGHRGTGCPSQTRPARRAGRRPKARSPPGEPAYEHDARALDAARPRAPQRHAVARATPATAPRDTNPGPPEPRDNPRRRGCPSP